MPVSSKPVEDASVESNEVVLNLSLGDDAQEGEPEEEMLEAEEEQLEEDEIQEGYGKLSCSSSPYQD